MPQNCVAPEAERIWAGSIPAVATDRHRGRRENAGGAGQNLWSHGMLVLQGRMATQKLGTRGVESSIFCMLHQCAKPEPDTT